jgi:hypothetical protein
MLFTSKAASGYSSPMTQIHRPLVWERATPGTSAVCKVVACLFLATACSSGSIGSLGNNSSSRGPESAGGAHATNGGSGSGTQASGGGDNRDETSDAMTGSGGTTNTLAGNGGKSSTGNGGTTNTLAGNGGKSSAGSGGRPPTPPAMGTPGVWEDVTSPDMDPSLFTGPGGFGVGNIVTDPARPTDIYAGGYGSIWKSTDYGLTWKKLDANPNPPYLPLGHVLAVAGTTPATLYMASPNGAQHVYKSTDGGATFVLTGTIPEQPDAASLYSIVVDPYDPTHLLSGLHEQDRVLESKDGGATWKFVTGNGFPSGGKSWFIFFLDTGDPTTTSKTWFAIAQDGGSAVKTKDGGATWVKPNGVVNLSHPHGGAGIFQNGKTIFVGGLGAQNTGDGVYRSMDLGDNFSQVASGQTAVVWGSSKNVYAMWGWACAGCGLNDGGPQYQTAPYPGDTWTKPTLPSGLVWGPNSVAITSDGMHSIYIGSMWATGLWRYVEP